MNCKKCKSTDVYTETSTPKSANCGHQFIGYLMLLLFCNDCRFSEVVKVWPKDER